ncbi:hypothetical protein ACF1AJ_16855 [Leifsonia sp. NPDC014704]|uniref:hypothetical protein n=1 Tax=Leifsonia sp. NPDC014704 TaxID=3364123 RepID=UPI0036F4A309
MPGRIWTAIGVLALAVMWVALVAVLVVQQRRTAGYDALERNWPGTADGLGSLVALARVHRPRADPPQR